MGEAKRRKQLDPNWGKPKDAATTIATFELSSDIHFVFPSGRCFPVNATLKDYPSLGQVFSEVLEWMDFDSLKALTHNVCVLGKDAKRECIAWQKEYAMKSENEKERLLIGKGSHLYFPVEEAIKWTELAEGLSNAFGLNMTGHFESVFVDALAWVYHKDLYEWGWDDERDRRTASEFERDCQENMGDLF